VIDTEEELTRLLPQIEAAPWVAIDTEADSLHAYPEKLCLIQASLPGTDALIDPLAGRNLRPFLSVLEGKPLLLHGADYDLRLLHRTYQFVPRAIFDTMWAARLLGYRTFSLRDLVNQHLGVVLEKGPQKMNWALRPLSERMVNYALNDTRYLRPVADRLHARLTDQGRISWHEEVCANLVLECSRPRPDNRETSWRLAGSDRLDSRSLAVLRELWLWRETEAISCNKPPYFIFSHEKLVELSAAAARGHVTPASLPSHFSPRRAALLALALERALQQPPSQYPQPRRSVGVRLTRDQQRKFDHLKRLRDARAEELGLDSSVVASKNDLVLLARDGGQANSTLMSWQRALLGL
jgi:ribonuclease D